VTFTEKAAGEMKLRIRTELARALEDAVDDEPRRIRLRTALAELEVAAREVHSEPVGRNHSNLVCL
jgi:ATP-dependent exoDNAse (exonuclease V) beta subunit